MTHRNVTELLVATHNAGKAREIAALLSPLGIAVRSAAEFNLPEPDETEDSFAGNARLKAQAAAQAACLPSLADDSGLCVNALGGEPGIYSARWAGPGKDFAAAMARVHDRLGDAADRSAYFVCVLALAWPDGRCEIFEGRIDGTIIWPPRGKNGFGYDPFLVPQGHDRSFGEMSAAEKHALSHRARAFAKLADFLTRK